MPDLLTGEKHIADVRTDKGLVIEFQHSPIKPDELTAREKFYKDMLWVVDGTRLKYDCTRFVKGQNLVYSSGSPGMFHVYDPAKCFPSAWVTSSVPVVFDFLGNASTNDAMDFRAPLYCLFPVRVGRSATFAKIPRKAFIKATLNGEWSGRVSGIMEKLRKEKYEWDNHEESNERSWEMHKLQMSRLNNPGL